MASSCSSADGLLVGAGQVELDAAILRAAFCSAVRGYWIGLSEALGGDQARFHTLRDHVLHYRVSALLRQDEVRRNPFLHQVGADRSVSV